MAYARGKSVLALAALAFAGTVSAQPVHWSVHLQFQLARLNAVDWRLARTGAQTCAARGPGTAAGSGIALDSLAAYPADQRAAIAAATGMSGGVDVIAVAAGSPGETAGFRPGDRLVTVRDVALEPKPEETLAAQQTDDLLRALPVDEPSAIVVERGGEQVTLTLVPLPRCSAHSVLVVEDFVDAYSDARNLALTTGFVDFTANDDELALLAGHELAHIVLDPEMKAAGLRSKARERAADRLGAQLAECAGYDIGLASALWGRFDSTRAFGFLPTLTHPMSKSRRLAIEAMAGKVDCAALAAGTPATP